jgi:acylphosphatase
MTGDTPRIRRAATIRGRVQGVGFRWTARIEARRLGLAGFVVNRADASVYLEAEGPAERVEALLDWVRIGPAGSEIASVDVVEREPLGSAGFDIL